MARESVVMGAGLASRDWRERQVVMMLANGACDGGLAGGEKREG
jgi:hypothetical protein